MNKKKTFVVTWTVAGSVEVEAENDADAADIIECMTDGEKLKLIQEEGLLSFEVGSTEEITE